MKPRQNFLQVVIPDGETFAEVRRGWPEGFVIACLERIWCGWDDLLKYFARQNVDPANIRWEEITQKERSLAHLHSLQIIGRQRPEDPFLFKPESHEMETLHSSRAMPPSYDFSFYLRGGNYRIALPIEAKYLLHAQDIERLCADLTHKYQSGKGAPLSPTAGLLGYVLSGTPEDFFFSIEAFLSCTLSTVPEFFTRPHRIGSHPRHLPWFKIFECHWIMCAFTTSSDRSEATSSE